MRHLLVKLAFSSAILAAGAFAVQACSQTTAMGKDDGSTGRIQLAQGGGGGGSGSGGSGSGSSGSSSSDTGGSSSGNSGTSAGTGNSRSSSGGNGSADDPLKRVPPKATSPAPGRPQTPNV